MRKQLVKTVSDILEKDPRVVLLLGDIGVYGFREAFAKYPKRVYNIGILEQASVGLAAGLALEGMIPIFHTIAPFMVERALEQLKIFGYQRLGGNFISVGGSYDYASLGATHHCPGDVQILKTIPGAQIFVPGHPIEFDGQFKRNYNNEKLSYFRLSEQFNAKGRPGGMIRPGMRGTILAIGPMLDRVWEACQDLDVTVLYETCVAPFDELTLHSLYPERLVIVEPFYEGTLAYDIQKQVYRPQILSIGVPRKFSTSYGTAAEHDEENGLTAPQIRERIKRFLNL